MSKIILDPFFKNLFSPNKKCIINADIDGIIAGMLLKKFLNWDIVGYSYCCGKTDDELWLKNQSENLSDCIFVDLPVSLKNYSVIDQHFISFSNKSIIRYNSDCNKANPNVMRNRMFCANQYASKYPFGTAHFVLAILENLGLIPSDYIIDTKRKIETFDVADLILRADRVIGNTNQYTQNCTDWANWMIDLGGRNTEALFSIVKKEHIARSVPEKAVENKLLSFGCKGADGDCSNLFRRKEYSKIDMYFSFLSDSLSLPKLPLFDVHNFGRLNGYKILIDRSTNLDIIENNCNADNVFSYAFVTMKVLSMTIVIENK